MRDLIRASVPRRTILALVVFGMVALSAGLLYASQAGGDQRGLGVDTDMLAKQGIHLSPPLEGYSPKIDSGQAIENANARNSRYHDVSYRHVVLKHLETPSLGGFVGDVWVLSVDTADPELTSDTPGGTMIYILRFVDAETGQPLMTLSKEAPPPGGWNSGDLPILMPAESSSTPASPE